MSYTTYKIKQSLKKLWWFIWEDDSIWSWLLNLVLAFVIVKFIIYPGLGLLLGTNLPVVAVVSSSMEHPVENLDAFWNWQGELYEKNYNINKAEFQTFKFTDGFNKGDLMVLSSAENPKVGDVIVFQGTASAPIIHRIILVTGNQLYTTKGDNNLGSRNDEMYIPKTKIYGKAVLRLPYLGWFKIGFVSALNKIGFNLPN